ATNSPSSKRLERRTPGPCASSLSQVSTCCNASLACSDPPAAPRPAARLTASRHSSQRARCESTRASSVESRLPETKAASSSSSRQAETSLDPTASQYSSQPLTYQTMHGIVRPHVDLSETCCLVSHPHAICALWATYPESSNLSMRKIAILIV